MRDGIDRAAARATAQRPGEQLRDGWDAAGLREIAALLRSATPDFLSAVWSNANTAAVDLERLVEYRGKNLHAVGPPTGQIGEQEIAAIVLRLRVGFEAARRELLGDTGQWWPYVASVQSNVEAYRFERSTGGARSCNAELVEGDLVTLDVTGVNPNGPQSELRYRLLGGPLADTGWQESGSFSFVAPLVQQFGMNLYTAAGAPFQHELSGLEHVSIMGKVRPQR